MPTMPKLKSSIARQSAGSLSDDLLECCRSQTLSEEALREIIQRHGLTSDDNRLGVGDYKFFQWACTNERVTEEIIRYMLEYFPQAAHVVDDYGMTPLHFACYNKSATLNIFRVLIEAAPTSARNVAILGKTCLHIFCENRKGDEANAVQILKLLIEAYPEAVRHAANGDLLPIHLASAMRSLEFCQVLLDAAPDSVSNATHDGWMLLHILCSNSEVDDGIAIQIMKSIIDKYPEAVRLTNFVGWLPIHIAANWSRSPEFCRVLIEAYPGSEQMSNANGALPLHWACASNSLATVEYLYKLYPNAIDHSTREGTYPVHFAIHGTQHIGNKHIPAVETVKFLLDCDTEVKLQKCHGRSLLHYACSRQTYNESNIEAALQVIGAIYDAHPEAIEDDRIASDVHNFHQRVQSFIQGELVYARQAKDPRLMTTPDENGQLPLHTAIQSDVVLGSIKLLVKGNPQAVQSPDNDGALPLHMACQHHDSTNIIQYLLGLDEASLDPLDEMGNTALHYACRGAKYDTITMLIEKYDAVSVSKRNAHDKLPIDLLWESNEASDRESLEYMDGVFQLVRAYPEMLRSEMM